MKPAFPHGENTPLSSTPAEAVRHVEAGTQLKFAHDSQCTATSWPVFVEHVLLYSVPEGLLYQVREAAC